MMVGSRVIKCISSISFSLLIKGVVRGYFYPSRGIRQVTVISSHFILCIEPLIRHFNLLASRTRNHIGVLSSPFGFRVPNLVFADDYLVFGKATSKAARSILRP